MEHNKVMAYFSAQSEYLKIPQLVNDKFAAISDMACQIILALIYFIVVVCWSLVIYFQGAPDESTHFFLVEYLYKFKTMPSLKDPSAVFNGVLSGYSYSPGVFWYYGLPFPHVVGALFTSAIGSMILPDYLTYLGVRAFNWVLGSLFVVALFRTARYSGISKYSAFLSVFIVMLIPQVSFVFAYFNSDAYGLTAVAWALSSLLAYCISPTRAHACVLGATVGLLMLAKLYFLPSLVFLGVTLLIRSLVGLITPPRHFLAMAISCVIVAAPMLIFTYITFGEIFGLSGQFNFIQMHKLNPNVGYGTCYLFCKESWIEWGNVYPWLVASGKSYFSVTGWMSILIDDWYYRVALFLAVMLIIISLVLVLPRWNVETGFSRPYDYILPLIMILGLFPSIVIMSLIASQVGLPQAQGRYLFVTIPFLAYLIALVLRRIDVASQTGQVVKQDSKSQYKISEIILFLIAVWMVLTNLVSLKTTFLLGPQIGSTPLMQIIERAFKPELSNWYFSRGGLKKDDLIHRLTLSENGGQLSIPVSTKHVLGNIDTINKGSSGFVVSGWAFIHSETDPLRFVVAVSDQTILGIGELGGNRPDVAVALGDKDAKMSGFSLLIPNISTLQKCNVKILVLTQSLQLYQMTSLCGASIQN